MDKQYKYTIKIIYNINKFYYKYVVNDTYNKWKEVCEMNKCMLYDSYQDIIYKCLVKNVHYIPDDVNYQGLHKMIASYNRLQEEHVAMFENIRIMLAEIDPNFNDEQYKMPKHIISLETIPKDIEGRKHFFTLLETNLQYIMLRLDTLLNILNL
jgi:hypothetical protein